MVLTRSRCGHYAVTTRSLCGHCAVTTRSLRGHYAYAVATVTAVTVTLPAGAFACVTAESIALTAELLGKNGSGLQAMTGSGSCILTALRLGWQPGFLTQKLLRHQQAIHPSYRPKTTTLTPQARATGRATAANLMMDLVLHCLLQMMGLVLRCLLQMMENSNPLSNSSSCAAQALLNPADTQSKTMSMSSSVPTYPTVWKPRKVGKKQLKNLRKLG